MPAKTPLRMLEQYQGNVYSSMLRSLGAQLHVSESSLARLELGWVPIMEFKKGPNFQGWWAIPERDAYGVPVGISLRSQRGWKCMAPGSNHGLIYPVNPAHERGRPAYQHGAHNWTRVADEGIECPVCRKPDGCLVSSEDVHDPRAVICIRTAQDAMRPMKLGWLHIRKPGGNTAGVPVIENSDHPILIVEGMTDVATALDIGFVAVGRPNNMGGLGILRDAVRGRDVIVLGENDAVNAVTGKRPGEEGMVATFQFLKEAVKTIQQVLPPSHVKDLRAWAQSETLTVTGVLEHIAANVRVTEELKIIPNPKPRTMAKAFLDATYRMAGRYTLRYRRGEWFRYDGTRYREVEPEVFIRGPIYQWADDKFVVKENIKGEETVRPLVCTRSTVGDMVDAMNDPALCPVRADAVPCWLNDYEGPNPENIIPFSNGLLYLPAYLEGLPEDRYLLPRTPDYFSHYCLPYAFDATAQAPDLQAWLRSTFPRESESRELLREWMGYSLHPHNLYQKLMIFRGPRRSGKSTAIDMIRSLVGADQCASPSFSSMTSTPHGLEGLLNKQAWLMGDVRVSGKQDVVRAMEILLNVAGDDAISIARKYKGEIVTKIPAKITMATNELPALPDHSGALQSRLLILNFNQSFYGREDRGIKNRLVQQAPGVMLWALEGLRALRERGEFSMPAQSNEAMDSFRTTSSPTASFVEECCEEHSGAEILKLEMYDAWQAWAKERGIRPISRGRFIERLRANTQAVHSETYLRDGHKLSVFKGIKLMPWAERNLLGKP